MKKDVHPEYTAVVHRQREVPPVSSASHPFWTGKARVLDSEGRVEEFRRRYGRS